MPEYVWQEPSECNRVDHVVVATMKWKITLNHMSFKSGGDCTLQILPLQIEKAGHHFYKQKWSNILDTFIYKFNEKALSTTLSLCFLPDFFFFFLRVGEMNVKLDQNGIFPEADDSLKEWPWKERVSRSADSSSYSLMFESSSSPAWVQWCPWVRGKTCLAFCLTTSYLKLLPKRNFCTRH